MYDINCLFSTECQPPSLAGVANTTSVCDSNGGAYTCRDGFTGMLCDRCENGFFNETACEGRATHTGSVESTGVSTVRSLLQLVVVIQLVPCH